MARCWGQGLHLYVADLHRDCELPESRVCRHAAPPQQVGPEGLPTKDPGRSQSEHEESCRAEAGTTSTIPARRLPTDCFPRFPRLAGYEKH